MKRIQLLSAILVISITVRAQPAPGSFVTNPELDKFAGTWKYQSCNDTFVLVLEKQVIPTKPPVDWTYEAIVGWYQYIEDGNLRESSIQHIGDLFDQKTSTIFGFNRTRDNGYTLVGGIHDIILEKAGEFKLTMTSSKFDQMTLTITERAGLKPDGFPYDFTIPTTMTLERQR